MAITLFNSVKINLKTRIKMDIFLENYSLLSKTIAKRDKNIYIEQL